MLNGWLNRHPPCPTATPLPNKIQTVALVPLKFEVAISSYCHGHFLSHGFLLPCVYNYPLYLSWFILCVLFSKCQKDLFSPVHSLSVQSWLYLLACVMLSVSHHVLSASVMSLCVGFMAIQETTRYLRWTTGFESAGASVCTTLKERGRKRERKRDSPIQSHTHNSRQTHTICTPTII